MAKERMQTLEARMNRLTDMNSGWWPFLHLRPSPNQEMDNRILLRMALHFGPFYGSILALVLIFQSQSGFPLVPVVASIAAVTVYFFLSYKFTFAVFWNRRARRLCAEQSIEQNAT